MENEDGQLRAKENIYSKNSKNDKKFNKKRFGLLSFDHRMQNIPLVYFAFVGQTKAIGN